MQWSRRRSCERSVKTAKSLQRLSAGSSSVSFSRFPFTTTDSQVDPSSMRRFDFSRPSLSSMSLLRRTSSQADGQYSSSDQPYGITREPLHARRRLDSFLHHQHAPIPRMVGERFGRVRSITLERKKRGSIGLQAVQCWSQNCGSNHRNDD